MKRTFLTKLLLIFATFFSAHTAFAEGTIDLVNSSSTANNATFNGGDCNWPYMANTTCSGEEKGGQPSVTRLWIYAETDEIINLGATVMEHAAASNNADIVLVAPDGSNYSLRTSVGFAGSGTGIAGGVGHIANRGELDNGPDLNGPGLGYTPWQITVGPGQTGIWSVQFLPGTPLSSCSKKTTAPGINWNFNSATDENATTFNMIAFDATVSQGTTSSSTAVIGRLFSTRFATNMATANANFCADFFSLSCDGLVYRTDINGVEIFGGTFFSDNKGHKLADGTRSYHSVDAQGDYNGVTPTLNFLPLNTLLDVTNYLYFNEPDITMPEQTFAYNGTATQAVRLLRTPLAALPNISTGSFDSYDQCLVFTVDQDLCEGLISIDIDGNGSFADAVDKKLVFDPEFGTNCIPWDYTDGTGAAVPVGTCQSFDVKFEVFIGEIHFPYADPERHDDGTYIERINGPYSGISGVNLDTMYYDDFDAQATPTPTTAAGSPITDATAGVVSPSYSFTSNENVLDFWAYIPAAVLTQAGEFACFNGDNDGLDDELDIDDDNDGTPDIYEVYDLNDATFCADIAAIAPAGTWSCSNLPDPSGDVDGDDIPNFKDPDFPGCGGLNANGVCINFDADGDGIPNHFDLDSDDDGIPDIIEQGGVDIDGDGEVDNPTDTDGDGLADVYDNDDTDGPLDATPCSPQPTCLQGSSTSVLQDSDGDGTPDRVVDTDGDGIEDYLDLDSDNDGIPDIVEAGGTDTDGDGRADNYIDNDLDGYNDLVDGRNCSNARFAGSYLAGSSSGVTNGGNIDAPDSDFADVSTTGEIVIDFGASYPAGTEFRIVWRNDGATSNVIVEESNDNSSYTAVTGSPASISSATSTRDIYTLSAPAQYIRLRPASGTGDAFGVDVVRMVSEVCNNGNPLILSQDGGTPDGIADTYTGGDTDNDGVLNHLDLDSDNDGIADVTEAGGADTDGDGILDIYATTADADNDGFADEVDGNIETGTPDVDPSRALLLTGTDENNNGRPNTYPNGDFDGDGIVNFLDLDADNDGVPDVVEAGGTDANGDGIHDAYDGTTPDGDNDGFADLVDAVVSAGPNPNGTPLITATADDGTGRPTGYDQGDFDNDGLLNHLDLDADNDGIPDVVEAGGADTDGDGILDVYATTADADNDGFADEVDGDISGGAGADPTRALILTLADSGDGTPTGYANGDADSDGLLDGLDLDADNDGIADVVEAGGTDTDGDGVHDAYDVATPDSDNDGFADIVDSDVSNGSNPNGTPLVLTTASSNGKATADDAIDTDGDGTPDRLDLDSDNDGIADVTEVGGTDTDGDGRHDGAITDIDGDGFTDLVDGNVPTGTNGTALILTTADGNSDGRPDNPSTDADFDGDGIANHLDLDSDNDGIADVVEAGGVDTDGDGVYDSFATDADNDGFADAVDGNIEGGSANPARALVRAAGDDGNGRADGYEPGFGDADADGKQNHLDLDADNDGIADVVEAGGVDNNGDGVLDTYATTADADNDGFADEVDALVPSGTAGTALITTGADSGNGRPATYNEGDTDGDAILDFLDLDSDNDGIADVSEAGGTDTDGDGRHDGAVTDTDNDGFTDIVDGSIAGSTALIETGPEGATVDGRPDSPSADADFDGDGIANHLDLDSDNDGIPDVVEVGGVDTDGDGIHDAYNTVVDADNDGFADIVDGNIETAIPDTDATRALVRAAADDGNGRADGYQAAPGTAPNPDADGDGLLNQLDLDADNDGIPDVVEANGVDTDGDGVHDAYDGATPDTDNTGFADLVEGSATAALITTDAGSNGRATGYDDGDADGDGLLNHLDLDADNDGIADVVEAGGTDGNNDGIEDGYDATTPDSDNDGFADTVDGDVSTGSNPNGTALILTGNDATTTDGRPDSYLNGNSEVAIFGAANTAFIDDLYDFLDIDADNDGITDAVENENSVAPAAASDLAGGTQLDGRVGNGSITDTDKNGWNDDNQGLEAQDFDSDGIPNYIDIDADNDAIPDYIEGVCTDCLGGMATVVNRYQDLVTATNDANNNGLWDVFESLNNLNDGPGTNLGMNPNDHDSDGSPDFLDLDTDDDTLADWAEGFDANGDGVAFDDIQGQAANYESANGSPGDYPATADPDSDGIHEWLDNRPAATGYSEGTPPPYLTVGDASYLDANNNGLVDLFDPFVTGGVEAFTPNNSTGGTGNDDWRDATVFTPLPIELTTFQAERAGQTALLTWVSETEINSSHYEVERSRDGVGFEYLGRVEAAGNTQSAREYNFVDAQPNSGVNYYRLRMVDLDGSFEYSEVRTVRFEDLDGAVQLFPNPTTNELNVRLPEGLNGQELRVEVTDVLGRSVLEANWGVQSNLNETLDVSQLPDGIYYLKLRTLTWEVVKPFQKH